MKKKLFESLDRMTNLNDMSPLEPVSDDDIKEAREVTMKMIDDLIAETKEKEKEEDVGELIERKQMNGPDLKEWAIENKKNLEWDKLYLHEKWRLLDHLMNNDIKTDTWIRLSLTYHLMALSGVDPVVLSEG